MTISCVLFDLDNTLTERRRSITNFALQFYDHFSGALGDMSLGKVESVLQAGDSGGYKPKEQMFAEMQTQLIWKDCPDIGTLRDYWYTVSPQSMEPRAGLFEMVAELKQKGILLGIITNGMVTVQDSTIDALGIRDDMDVVLISERVGIRKPDPKIFEMALNELNVRAAKTYFVGDHPLNDIAGAANSGIAGVWIQDDTEWPLDLAPPQFVIRNLSEVLLLVDQP